MMPFIYAFFYFYQTAFFFPPATHGLTFENPPLPPMKITLAQPPLDKITNRYGLSTTENSTSSQYFPALANLNFLMGYGLADNLDQMINNTSAQQKISLTITLNETFTLSNYDPENTVPIRNFINNWIQEKLAESPNFIKIKRMENLSTVVQRIEDYAIESLEIKLGENKALLVQIQLSLEVVISNNVIVYILSDTTPTSTPLPNDWNGSGIPSRSIHKLPISVTESGISSHTSVGSATTTFKVEAQLVLNKKSYSKLEKNQNPVVGLLTKEDRQNVYSINSGQLALALSQREHQLLTRFSVEANSKTIHGNTSLVSNPLPFLRVEADTSYAIDSVLSAAGDVKFHIKFEDTGTIYVGAHTNEIFFKDKIFFSYLLGLTLNLFKYKSNYTLTTVHLDLGKTDYGIQSMLWFNLIETK
ncbi:MAG: hypothetical protein K1X29_00110 [Bdellovibrionales bacterium]|nr:hypothetical protein [Bdellovibrionales bacterium]